MFIAVMLLHVQYQLELPASIDAEVSKQQWPFQSSSGQLVDPAKAKERVRLMLNRTSLWPVSSYPPSEAETLQTWCTPTTNMASDHPGIPSHLDWAWAGSYSNLVAEKVVRPCKTSQPQSPLSPMERQRSQSIPALMPCRSVYMQVSHPILTFVDPTTRWIAENCLQA